MDCEGSGDTSSASESSVEIFVTRLPKCTSAPSKKRKTTYYARKDEIQELHEQIKLLEEKLAIAEQNAHLPLAHKRITNALLTNAVTQNSLSVAGSQSMLTAYTLASVQSQRLIPMKAPIHMPADLNARNALMASMYESKLLEATQYITERTRHLDLRIAQRQTENFELLDGKVCIFSMDVTQFDTGHSLRQVYDAFQYFVMNQEMSVSEKLGYLTIRESEEMEEFKYGQTRFLTTVPGGVEVETNVVMFAKYVEATETSPAYAISTLDSVDEDDLYPYRPEICMRKELAAILALQEIPSTTGDPPIVAMTRWCYGRNLPPEFPLDDEAKTMAYNSMLEWCDFIPRTMKERLSTIVPAATAKVRGEASPLTIPTSLAQ